MGLIGVLVVRLCSHNDHEIALIALCRQVQVLMTRDRNTLPSAQFCLDLILSWSLGVGRLLRAVGAGIICSRLHGASEST